MLGNLSLPEFIKVGEELFDSDTLHDNESLHSLFNVTWVVVCLNSLLLESVMDDVEVLCFVSEESVSCVSELTVHNDWLWCRVFGYVFGEYIFCLVDISAEVEVVNFSDVALVEILS